MDEIKFFLKFGERKHLEDLQKGNLFFSNAQTFRYYEEKLFIKGQGDRLEGGSMIAASNVTMIDNATQEPVFTGIKGTMFVHYEPANLLPVFCIFSCFAKDCVTNESGQLVVKLSDELKDNILSHFPKADTVAIIKNPKQFISDIQTTIGFECKSDLVNYFHLMGFDSKHGTANDLSYFKYLTQDVPPKKDGNKTVYSFNAEYVYRSLLCKDVFFSKEQEYRFILPRIKIAEGKIFPVCLQQKIELQDLDAFFAS